MFIAINIAIFIFNVLLFLNAGKVVTFLNHGEENKRKTIVFKVFNILFLLTHGLDLIFQEHASSIISVGYSLISVYIGILVFEIISYFNRIKFGTKIKSGETTKYDENYNVKINNIFIFVVVASIVILNLLKIWDMESALEQKGFIGIVLAALLFTSAHWLPNIFKGLTLMNSNRVSKGDVIRMQSRYYIIFDMGLQYTRLLDVESNKRVLLENAKFSENRISNISKKASTVGYRESIEYNIGYPSLEIVTEEEYDKHINRFKSIFKEIYEEIEGNKEFKIDIDAGYELFMVEAGDFALKYKFSFYYSDFSKLSTTGAIRKILSSKHRLNELVQKKAHLKGISLATPSLAENDLRVRLIKDEVIKDVKVIDNKKNDSKTEKGNK